MTGTKNFIVEQEGGSWAVRDRKFRGLQCLRPDVESAQLSAEKLEQIRPSSAQEIRLVIRCQKEVNHGKVLRIDPGLGMGYAETLAGLLDGSSHYYIHPPGEGSPIGKCAVCGGQLKCEISNYNQKGEG